MLLSSSGRSVRESINVGLVYHQCLSRISAMSVFYLASGHGAVGRNTGLLKDIHSRGYTTVN